MTKVCSDGRLALNTHKFDGINSVFAYGSSSCHMSFFFLSPTPFFLVDFVRLYVHRSVTSMLTISPAQMDAFVSEAVLP